MGGEANFFFINELEIENKSEHLVNPVSEVLKTAPAGGEKGTLGAGRSFGAGWRTGEESMLVGPEATSASGVVAVGSGRG